MKESTIDLLNKKLGEEVKKLSTGRTMGSFSEDLFTTGERIKKEMEAIEHLIEEEGVTKFLERAGDILKGNTWRKEDAGDAGTDTSVETDRGTGQTGELEERLREDEAENINPAKSDT